MRTKSGRGDVLLVCMVLFLVVFGLAVLYSTGSYNGSVRFGDAFYYMKKQFFAAALGMLAMYLISCMDYHIFEKYAIAAYLISLALSTLVLFAGNAYNGSRRWLSLGPLSFQPSEFAKLAVILFLARMVGRQKKKREQFSEPGVCDCSGTADRGTGRDEQLKYGDHHSRHRSDRSVCIGQKIYAVCVDRGGRSRHDGVVPWDGVLPPGEDRHLEKSGSLRKGLSDNPGTLCDRFRRTVRQRIRREHPEARIRAGGTE